MTFFDDQAAALRRLGLPESRVPIGERVAQDVLESLLREEPALTAECLRKGQQVVCNHLRPGYRQYVYADGSLGEPEKA